MEKVSMLEKGFVEYSKIKLEEVVVSRVGKIVPTNFETLKKNYQIIKCLMKKMQQNLTNFFLQGDRLRCGAWIWLKLYRSNV